MQMKRSAALVLGAAIVLAALIVALSPLMWTDHWAEPYGKSVPTGCSIQVTATNPGALAVAHCPIWVSFPN